MAAFNDAIEKMLWPERRDRDAVLGTKVPGMMDRTTDPELSQGRRPATCRTASAECRALPSACFRRRLAAKGSASVRFPPARPSPCSPASISSPRTPTRAARPRYEAKAGKLIMPHDRGPQEAAAERHR